jgi:hypothetical protein
MWTEIIGLEVASGKSCHHGSGSSDVIQENR